jgi:hypothetical protein
MALLPMLDDLLDDETDRQLAFAYAAAPDRRPEPLPCPPHPRSPLPCPHPHPSTHACAPCSPPTLTRWWPSTPPSKAAPGATTSNAACTARSASRCCTPSLPPRRTAGWPATCWAAWLVGEFGRSAPALRIELVGVRPNTAAAASACPVRRPAALGRAPWRHRDPHAVELEAQQHAGLAGQPGLRAGAHAGDREPSSATAACTPTATARSPSTPAKARATRSTSAATRPTTRNAWPATAPTCAP